MTVVDEGEEQEGKNNYFNRSWVRSTDLKRELKEKLLKAQQEQIKSERLSANNAASPKLRRVDSS